LTDPLGPTCPDTLTPEPPARTLPFWTARVWLTLLPHRPPSATNCTLAAQEPLGMAMALRCKRCGSEEQVKNGFMKGLQRYHCKACGLNFTETPPRGFSRIAASVAS
jgi:hypothetical protein